MFCHETRKEIEQKELWSVRVGRVRYINHQHLLIYLYTVLVPYIHISGSQRQAIAARSSLGYDKRHWIRNLKRDTRHYGALQPQASIKTYLERRVKKLFGGELNPGLSRAGITEACPDRRKYWPLYYQRCSLRSLDSGCIWLFVTPDFWVVCWGIGLLRHWFEGRWFVFSFRRFDLFNSAIS